MDYRNADGSLAEMCGNGIRVFAPHLYDEGLVPAGRPVRIATRDGVKTVTRDGDRFTADLGRRPDPRRDQGVGGRPVLAGDPRRPGQPARGRRWSTTWRRPAALYDEPSYDERLYPEGVNVEFVVRRGVDHLAMRVHERGSGETRSCGTGACAAAVARGR